MESAPRHLRGWKEIAAYLEASERGVKRWEKTRRLPIHRVGGATRDVVFALTDEIDDWVAQSAKGRRDDTEVKSPTAPGDISEDGPDGTESRDAEGPSPPVGPASSSRRSSSIGRFAIRIGAALLLAAVLVGAYRLSRNWRGTLSVAASDTPKAASRRTQGRPVLLELTSRESVGTRVTIRDGECGLFQTSSDGKVELCPVLLGDGLLLEIVDVRHPADRAYKMRLRLEPHSRVHVSKPLPFDVMWLSGASGRQN